MNYPWSTDGQTVFYGLDFGANVWGSHLGVATRRDAIARDFGSMERWRSECSCRMRDGTSQAWRAPLRDAVAELADGLHAVYNREARRYFDDPWAVRDAYGEVVATPEKIESWVATRVTRSSADSERPGESAESRVPSPQSLLEMERGALRIFTSCAWFFDDIGGLEPIEVLRYAARGRNSLA